jgi:hypothetical protein
MENVQIEERVANAFRNGTLLLIIIKTMLSVILLKTKNNYDEIAMILY